MKKLLNSDWLRAVQLKSNTSAKSIIIPVQITKLIKILESDLQSTGVRDWNIIKSFQKSQIICTFKNFLRNSEVFQAFPNTSKDF